MINDEHTPGKERFRHEYLVIYSSRTGNTEKIAMEIFEALPGNSRIFREWRSRAAKRILIL